MCCCDAAGVALAQDGFGLCKRTSSPPLVLATFPSGSGAYALSTNFGKGPVSSSSPAPQYTSTHKPATRARDSTQHYHSNAASSSVTALVPWLWAAPLAVVPSLVLFWAAALTLACYALLGSVLLCPGSPSSHRGQALGS